MHRVHRTVRRSGSCSCPQNRVRDTETNFFPFHIPPRLNAARSLIDPQGCERRISAFFSPSSQSEESDKDDHHGGEYGPSLARIFHHRAVRVTESGGNEKDRK